MREKWNRLDGEIKCLDGSMACPYGTGNCWLAWFLFIWFEPCWVLRPRCAFIIPSLLEFTRELMIMAVYFDKRSSLNIRALSSNRVEFLHAKKKTLARQSILFAMYPMLSLSSSGSLTSHQSHFAATILEWYSVNIIISCSVRKILFRQLFPFVSTPLDSENQNFF